MSKKMILAILVLALGLMVCPTKVSGQIPLGTAFTYQGFLMDNKKPAEEEYDFQFSLYNDPSAGSQEGDTIVVNALDVNDGYFAVDLDFGGDVFTGDARWLDIELRRTGSGDPYTPLYPRVRLTLTPYALYALSAEDANTVEGYEASAFAQTGHSHYSLDAVDGSPTNVVYVDDAGNVGIGTTEPGAKLEVAGQIKITGSTPGANKVLTSDASGLANWQNLQSIPGGVPSGVIVMWSGSIASIPPGWALCDGQVHDAKLTPDLRDRFVIGARQDDGDVAKTTVKGTLMKTGGEHEHTLTIPEIPSHTHTESGHGSYGSQARDDPIGCQQTTQTGSRGGDQPHENCPPFYALAFIMKV